MRNNSGGCLTAFVSFFSRIALLIFYFSRPVAWNAAFPGGFLLPCLGFLFMPFTTMVYAWLMQGVGGIPGGDWLWLGLARSLTSPPSPAPAMPIAQAIPGYPSWTTPPARAAQRAGPVDAGLQRTPSIFTPALCHDRAEGGVKMIDLSGRLSGLDKESL